MLAYKDTKKHFKTKIEYDNIIYKCNSEFIKYKYTILQAFLSNYKSSIHIYKKNLTNFFSLIYPNIKENLKIDADIFEELKKYIPQVLVPKLYLDFDDNGYIIFSRFIDKVDRRLLNMDNSLHLIKIEDEHKYYLKYHRDSCLMS